MNPATPTAATDVSARWLELARNGAAIRTIELLRRSRESVVYRLDTDAGRVIAKRCPTDTARIEQTVYEQVLPRLAAPKLRFFGAVAEDSDAYRWLFVEEAVGRRYEPDEPEHRRAAATWLARLHQAVQTRPPSGPLPPRQPDHYFALLTRARRMLDRAARRSHRSQASTRLLSDVTSHCKRLAARWAQLAEACEPGTNTLVHGDIVTHNAVVAEVATETVFVPFDWEKAGWGTPAEDLSSVDIDAYCAAGGAAASQLDPGAARRLAGAGKIFRCLVFLDWLGPELDSNPTFALEQIALCRSWLDVLTEQAPWSS